MKYLESFLLLAFIVVVSTALKIGDRCTDDESCDMPNSMCVSICTCKSGFTHKNDLSGCLPIRDSFNASCEQREQCQEGDLGNLSTCTNNMCQCMDHAVYGQKESMCLVKANKTGDSCTNSLQCIGLGLSKCEGEKCICNDNGVEKSDKSACLEKLYLGRDCDTNEAAQCTHIPNSECSATSRICSCVIGYVNPNDRTCLKETGQIGDGCTHDVQCLKLNGTKCGSNNTCECQNDQVGSDDKMKCLQKVDRLGGNCTDTTQCSPEHSDCLPDSSSDGNPLKCLCGKDYVQSGSVCIEAKQLGDRCDFDVECSKIGYGSTVKCISNVCACPLTEPPSRFYNERCVEPALWNETCSSHDSCMLGVNNRTRCAGNPRRCTCADGDIEREGICWEQLTVGGTCNRDVECRQTIAGPVRCEKKVCACDSGFPASKEGLRCTGSSFVVGRAQYILAISVIIFVSMGLFKQ